MAYVKGRKAIRSQSSAMRESKKVAKVRYGNNKSGHLTSKITSGIVQEGVTVPRATHY